MRRKGPDAFELLNEYPNWIECFDAGALKRGEVYASEGKSELAYLDGQKFSALCEGSAGQTYRQTIEVSVHAGRCIVEGDCSCPVGYNCKHCAAALLLISDPFDKPLVAKPTSAQMSAELQYWLSNLEQAPAPVKPGKDKRGRSVCYNLHLQDDASCSVVVRKGTETEDGIRFSRVQSVYDFLYDRPKFVTEEDARILRLLSSLNQGGGQERGYKLTGGEGGELLQRIIDTGRLYLFDTQPPLQPGPVRQGEFRWVRLDNGAYRGLWFTGEDKSNCVIPLLPLYYLDMVTHEIGVLEHGLNPHVAMQLTLAPEVPEHLVVPLSHKLNALSHAVPTPTEVQEQHIDDIQPTAHLVLGSLEFTAYMPKTGRMQRQMQHRAALSFDYDGLSASGNTDKPLTRLVGSVSQRISRQPKAEQALRNVLRDMGFKVATRQSKALPDSAGEMFLLPDDEAWLQFVRTDLPRLREAGWQVDVNRDFAFDLQEVEDWYATVDETPGHEWFDLELGIVVEGQRHSLLPIVLQLLRNSPELLRPSELAKRNDEEHLLIDLNRGRIDAPALRVALPYGRVKAVMATLGELYLSEPEAGTALRMSRADAARLNGIEALPLHWEGGEHVRDLGRRLRDARDLQVAPPAGLQANLRGYQQQGLNWLQALRAMGTGGILGDDMGLGKTLQALAHVLLEKEAGRLGAPALAVMPTSLIPNWLDEAQRFAPGLRVLALHGPARSKHFARLQDYDLILTTYALVPRDLAHLRAQPWHLLLLDEAQNIKSSTSKAAMAVCQLQATQRLCLTGTPMENNLGELWSIFHFLMPGWLGDLKRFNQDYRTPIERQGNTERLTHLITRIRPFLLRRTKEQVATELPAKTELVHWVELSDAQRDTYEAVRVAMDKKVRDEVARNGAARSQIVILDALLKLRQVCCDLRLVKGVDIKGNQSDKGKLGALLEMLEELMGEGRRVLLFSQFTSMLALIEQELKKRSIRYSLLTGDTRDRRTPVQQFQEGDSQVFLISLKAGGVGLNLTAADTVIHYDPWWNPASENQATDRAYRIGQDKPVFVFKLITRGTVEEKIQLLQQEKAALAASLLDGGKAGQWRLGDEEIEALFAPLPGKRGR